MWAERLTESSFAAHAVDSGIVTSEDLRELAAAWHRWIESPDGWFMAPHGEILCHA